MPPVLSFFDITKPTHLTTEFSKQGVGFFLQQTSIDDWTLVQAGSWFLSNVESRYRAETTCSSVGCWKMQGILRGTSTPLHSYRPHSPLVLILNNQCLDNIENIRLQRVKSCLVAFNFTAQWVKGNHNNKPTWSFITKPHQWLYK